jgi:hypothetical protein
MEPGIKTIVAFDSRSGDRSLVAEVHPHIQGVPPKEELRAFEQRLFDDNVRTGLFITSTHFVVVLDTLKSMESSDNHYQEIPIESQELFSRAGSDVTRHQTVFDKVQSYLKLLPHIWGHSVPYEALKAFMPFVVGSLVGAEFESFDGNYTNYAASA